MKHYFFSFLLFSLFSHICVAQLGSDSSRNFFIDKNVNIDKLNLELDTLSNSDSAKHEYSLPPVCLFDEPLKLVISDIKCDSIKITPKLKIDKYGIIEKIVYLDSPEDTRIKNVANKKVIESIRQKLMELKFKPAEENEEKIECYFQIVVLIHKR